jgi:hypothetical protein
MTAVVQDFQTKVFAWGPLAASVSGETLYCPAGTLAVGTVQLTGTFGGSVFIEGSLDGVNFVTLNDLSGTPLQFSGPALAEFSTNCAFIRPRTGAGVAAVTARIRVAR